MEETANQDPNYTIVEYIKTSSCRCGYCKSPDSASNKGMWAHRMTVGHYQALIDRGWRRSGKFVYKPTMKETCCPQYTIRCDASKFQLSKSQKKVLKRMNNFLRNGKKNNELEDSMESDGKKSSNGNADSSNSAEGSSDEPMLFQKFPDRDKISENIKLVKDPKRLPDSTNESNESQQTGADPARSPCKKAKILRQEKRSSKGAPSSKKPKNQPKSLEEYLNEPLPADSAHKLELKLVRVIATDRLFRDSYMDSYGVYHQYQTIIHNDLPTDCDEESYESFLVENCFEPWYPLNGPVHGYGAFHQQYWLDGRLIAVGVLDILPSCISSVYLYYDPEFSFLSLGTYAALREIALVRQLHKSVDNLKWYYMGFYIHSCPKMRYKGNYSPSFLLCPEVYTWHPIEKCLPLLDVKKYSRLNDDPFAKDKDGSGDPNKVLCLYESSPIFYDAYLKMRSMNKKEEEVEEYVSLVGKKAASTMLLYRI